LRVRPPQKLNPLLLYPVNRGPKGNRASVLTPSIQSMTRRMRMVVFELSFAYIPNIAMRNSSAVLSLARGQVFRSVPWSQRLPSPYPWRLDILLLLLFLNTGHSVTACLCSPDGSAGHTVCFHFLYGSPLWAHITLVYTLSVCLL
jgi:hypothetical protein